MPLFNTDYILNPYEKQIKEDLNREYDAKLQSYGITPVNTSNYSLFGIAANTPGMSLAEAQILNDILKKY